MFFFFFQKVTHVNSDLVCSESHIDSPTSAYLIVAKIFSKFGVKDCTMTVEAICFLQMLQQQQQLQKQLTLLIQQQASLPQNLLPQHQQATQQTLQAVRPLEEKVCLVKFWT